MEEPKPKGFQSKVLEAGLQLDFSLSLGRSEWLSGVYLKVVARWAGVLRKCSICCLSESCTQAAENPTSTWTCPAPTLLVTAVGFCSRCSFLLHKLLWLDSTRLELQRSRRRTAAAPLPWAACVLWDERKGSLQKQGECITCLQNPGAEPNQPSQPSAVASGSNTCVRLNLSSRLSHNPYRLLFLSMQILKPIFHLL